MADHCTVCHKCLNPCPVNIDFGDVSIRMRAILRRRGHKRTSPATWAAMKFLNATDPRTIKVLRKGMAEWGFKGLSLAHDLVGKTRLLGTMAGAGYAAHPGDRSPAFFADIRDWAGKAQAVAAGDRRLSARLHEVAGGTYLWVANPTRRAILGRLANACELDGDHARAAEHTSSA